MHLAEQLGAKIETVCGDDIPFLIAEYAKNSGISKIVTGRSVPSRSFFHKPTFTDKLAAYAPDIDIYIIPDNKMEKEKQKLRRSVDHTMTIKNMLSALGSPNSWKNCWAASG